MWEWFQRKVVPSISGQRDRTPTNTEEFHHQGENGVGGQCWGVVTKLWVDITLCQHNDVCPCPTPRQGKKRAERRIKKVIWTGFLFKMKTLSFEHILISLVHQRAREAHAFIVVKITEARGHWVCARVALLFPARVWDPLTVRTPLLQQSREVSTHLPAGGEGKRCGWFLKREKVGAQGSHSLPQVWLCREGCLSLCS